MWDFWCFFLFEISQHQTINTYGTDKNNQPNTASAGHQR